MLKQVQHDGLWMMTRSGAPPILIATAAIPFDRPDPRSRTTGC
jgi:hypothetical protein